MMPKKPIFNIYSALIIFMLAAMVGACSDEPTAGNPNANQPDMVQDMDGGDGGVVDTDMSPDMNPATPNQRLVLQPVSGSGTVQSARFKAHLQIGRVIEATSK
jgi:hypothetical protein